MDKTKDRVSYSLSRKIPTAKRFETVDVHFSYSTDVGEGETAQEAMKRTVEFVEKWSNWRINQEVKKAEATKERRARKSMEDEEALDAAIAKKRAKRKAVESENTEMP